MVGYTSVPGGTGHRICCDSQEVEIICGFSALREVRCVRETWVGGTGDRWAQGLTPYLPELDRTGMSQNHSIMSGKQECLKLVPQVSSRTDHQEEGKGTGQLIGLRTSGSPYSSSTSEH